MRERSISATLDGLLEILDLYRQRGLRHSALTRGAAEMQMPCDRVEITELAQGDAAGAFYHRFFLSHATVYSISAYGRQGLVCASLCYRSRAMEGVYD